MAVNKVDYGDTNLIDLTQDTVDENSVLAGYTFHGADGNIKEGKVVVAEVIDDLNSQSTEDALSANQGRLLNVGINKTRDMISDAWNSSITYTVGQYCIYNDCLWKCKVQHTSQTPSEGTYWTKTQIDDEILSIKNDVSTINSNFTYSDVSYQGEIVGNDDHAFAVIIPNGYNPLSCCMIKDIDNRANSFGMLGSPITNGDYARCRWKSLTSGNVIINVTVRFYFIKK